MTSSMLIFKWLILEYLQFRFEFQLHLTKSNFNIISFNSFEWAETGFRSISKVDLNLDQTSHYMYSNPKLSLHKNYFQTKFQQNPAY